MAPKPDPQPGLIIKFDDLWKEEERQGREDGAKDRPCAIVVASEKQADGDRRLLVCPITHTKPESEKDGIAVPPKVARHLGLDDRPSWIKTNELNKIAWSDPSIVPANPN